MENAFEFYEGPVGRALPAPANDWFDMGSIRIVMKHMKQGKPTMGTGLFNRTGVRYEVAVDVLGALISHHAEIIATEREKASPDASVVAASELEQKKLRDVREELDASDSTAVERVIAAYAPQARAAYGT